MRDKGFLALTIAQFWSALNDNAFKFMVTLLCIQWVSDPGMASRYVSIASGIFVLPFILFSTHAGYVADRFSKRSVAIGAKIAEILVMLLAVGALHMRSLPAIMAVLFLMGLHSTFFSPAKYGMLPEILDEKDLSNGNGIINLSTFMAIILGTLVGGEILNRAGDNLQYAGWMFVLIAVLGTAASLFITPTLPAQTTEKMDWNPIRKSYLNLKEAAGDRVLGLSVAGTGYFWLVGALLIIVLPLYGKFTLGLEESKIQWLLACLSIGIGLGSGIAGKISGEKVELGLVPLGSIGLGIFCLDIAFGAPSFLRGMTDIFFLGASAGFFVIPLNALIQARAPKESKGKMIATTNIVSFIAIGLASLLNLVLTDHSLLGLSSRQVFGIVGFGTIFATAYVLWLLPAAFTRLVFWFITHSVYRIKVIGRENIPLKGPALLVSNHVAYIDPFLVAASVSRNIRFFMWRPIYEFKPLNWFFKMMNAIPISATDGPKKFMSSMEEARQALRDGHVVCIFAEGSITRLGQTLGFKKGVEIIAKDLDVPIIPIHLDRVWGSIFSFHGKQFIWKLPKKVPYPVTLSFGGALPSTSKAHEVRQAVMDLGSAAFNQREDSLMALHRMFLRQAKSSWTGKCMADSSGIKLNYGQTVTASFWMARQLKNRLGKSENVGVLIPSTVPGALVNVALPMLGKTPVNLNFTMSEDLVGKIVQKSGIEKIITSRKVLEALKWKEDARMIFIEDLQVPSIIVGSFLWLLLWALPSFLTEMIFLPQSRKGIDEVATLMFTSGSTGDPKGVMLTHRNIQSNVQGLQEIFQLDSTDVLIGVLPFFHSFGFTATIWFPLLGGFPVVYHKSPLEAAMVDRLIREHRGTVLLGTPTFLQMWSRKFKKEDVASVKFAMVGAEKLRDSIAKEFEEKFNIKVLEGYGCTELSPVAVTSALNVQAHHESQVGHKSGKVGRPLPGVTIKIVDPETNKNLPQGEAGLMLVKGPNVMKGYFGDPGKTSQVILDGWYVTGDIARIDEEGFIEVTDRMSRFSKIGGEMVPHIHVEEKIYEMASDGEARFIVTSVPDDKRGEALAVLYFNYSGSIDALFQKLQSTEMPKLWIPAPDSFFKLDEWPTLGTGKVDLARAKSIAKSKLGIA